MADIKTSASPRKREVLKYQALGNSYLILDPHLCKGLDVNIVGHADGSIGPTSQLTRRLCDVGLGIGSNGLLFGPFCVRDRDIFGLRIINSDGTPAGFSGNGIRIFAQYLLDAGYTRLDASIRIRPFLEDEPSNAERVVPVRVSDDGSGLIDVTLPYAPKFGPNTVGAREGSFSHRPGEGNGFSFTVNARSRIGADVTGKNGVWDSSTFVELGNPHCVTFISDTVDLPSLLDFSSHYSKLRTLSFQQNSDADEAPVFAFGVNLQWVKIVNRSEIELVVYERGEGPTAASRSSACAAASAAFVRGLVDSKVRAICLADRWLFG
jgi:diaminopimelate epimerase